MRQENEIGKSPRLQVFVTRARIISGEFWGKRGPVEGVAADPNYLDIRSPCGAGIGQIAYSYDGKIYTCDEGRMLGGMGDDIFCIGNVHSICHACSGACSPIYVRL